MYSEYTRNEESWFGACAVTFISVVVLLFACGWGMYAHDFIFHLITAAMVAVIGIPLTLYCFYRLKRAQELNEARIMAELRETDTLMHFENKTIINQGNGKTITIQQMHGNALKKLKAENETLKNMLKALEEAFHTRIEQHNADVRNFAAERSLWNEKFDNQHRNYKRFFRISNQELEARREEVTKLKKKIDDEKANRAELIKLRKAERARKSREGRLLDRIRKARNQPILRQLEKSRTSLASSLKVEHAIDAGKGKNEVSNDIIALVEYMRHYDPSKELQAYLWDCRDIKTLVLDIYGHVVRKTFGQTWETLLLSGLAGLNIIDIATLVRISRQE